MDGGYEGDSLRPHNVQTMSVMLIDLLMFGYIADTRL